MVLPSVSFIESNTMCDAIAIFIATCDKRYCLVIIIGYGKHIATSDHFFMFVGDRTSPLLLKLFRKVHFVVSKKEIFIDSNALLIDTKCINYLGQFI